MPTDAGSHHESDRDRDKERERDRDADRAERADRGGSKSKSSATSKTKDLSHVPCKFFKVGGCTAGSSCPFSHSNVEPGGQKETCTWFIKGNCKFGHKCALAHVLPGQSMAMDRKNKKAAQTAAAASGGGDKGAKAAGRVKRESPPGGNRLPLLAGGATATMRIVPGSGSSSSGRPPMNMPLKATISPSAPAPPLKDTDFTSFASLDDMDDVLQPNSSSAQGSSEQGDESSKVTESSDEAPPTQQNQTPASVDVPVLLPRPSATPVSNDFGPIGSPPGYRSSQPISPTRLNGGTFSAGTSPRGHSHINGVNINNPSPKTNNNASLLSSSPFSAPGSQSAFMSPSYQTGGGIAASLGSGLAMMGGRRGWGDGADASSASPNSFSGLLGGQLSSSVSQTRSSGMNGYSGRGDYDISIEYDDFNGTSSHSRKKLVREDSAVDDGDLEDFLPSSLNDLLTPEERSRRMSRSTSGQGAGVSHLTSALATATGAGSGMAQQLSAEGNGNGNGASGMGHRYSRSVPAPTLLGDIKSIWADTNAPPLPSSPPANRGTPSSAYPSRFDPYSSGGMHGDEIGLSMSMGSAGTASSIGMMSPSNASAAFLPGLHHHYMSAKAKQAQAQQSQLGMGGIQRQLRGASNPAYPGPTAGTSNNSLANNYLQPIGGLGLPSSASSSSGFHTHTHGNTQTTYRTTPSPFDLTQTMHQPQQSQTARPIPSNFANQAEDALLAPHILSPSSRALQSHAPGQSLPQGLAAGYSRIHALPPLTNIASPPTSGSYNPGTSPSAANNSYNNEVPYGDWPVQTQTHGQSSNSNQGLDSMFSRLSYSAATRTGGPSPASGPPPGLTRNVSGGRYNQQQQQQGGPLSPLSGPVVTRDDDDLFDMDK